jgi:hypothetical protein
MAVGGWLGRLTGTGRSALAVWDTRLGPIVHAGLVTAGGDDLLSMPDPDGKGAQSTVQHRVRAIVGPLQGRDDSAEAHPDQGGMQELSSCLRELCLLGRENAGVSMILENLVTI